MKISEVDVVVTDYLLTIEALILAAWLHVQPGPRADLRLWFAVFFVSAGLASATGGTVHGFFPATSSALGRGLWRVALIAIGLAAASAWIAGSRLLFGNVHAQTILVAVMIEWLAYAIVVTTTRDAFSVAIANYVPATLFLIAAYVVAYSARPVTAIAIGLGGLVLTLVAAAGQRLRLALHPVYFNHNAVYHVVQGIALFMIGWSARAIIAG